VSPEILGDDIEAKRQRERETLRFKEIYREEIVVVRLYVLHGWNLRCSGNYFISFVFLWLGQIFIYLCVCVCVCLIVEGHANSYLKVMGTDSLEVSFVTTCVDFMQSFGRKEIFDKETSSLRNVASKIL
jgi:hypothetical protein